MSKYDGYIDEIVALLSKEGGWCQKSYARTESGNTIGPQADNAVSFCLSGAKMRVTMGKLTYDETCKLNAALFDTILELFPVRMAQYRWQTIGIFAVYSFNDHPDTTLADVLSVWSSVKSKLKLQEEDA